mmetsp:Transcript_4586/g.11099  ORF Transcript_4586/g.11099 Transcript_4586/m.11099 type:complete len:354 (+) Transcript_4586:41-1102(+)
MATALDTLQAGDRVRIQGGKNFEKFHGGMEGTILDNWPENANMRIQFDDVATSGTEPTTVAYRHLEAAPEKGGYRAGNAASSAQPAQGSAQAKVPEGPLLDEHGEFKTRQLVELHSLQGAADLNGKIGRLRKFDPNAGRWDVDVRDAGAKRLKEENLRKPTPLVVQAGLTVEELKNRGNEHFKVKEWESAAAYYSAAIDLLEEGSPKPAEGDDPKYVAVVYGNRSQCYINLCREVQGDETSSIAKEARSYAMKANIDSARAVELDPTNGKAYYRRGCAVLGMAPSASRSKEAIYYLDTALSGRASGGKDGIILPNAMRQEVSNLLDYAKRRFDAFTEMAVPDIEQCRENCRQQ